jgi:hypothetical protein
MILKFERIFKLVTGICNLVILTGLWIMSPYKYAWDPELKQPNEDAIIVIKLCTVIIICVSAIILIANRKSSKYLNLVHFINLLFSILLLTQSFLAVSHRP